ncbi:MAG TPA: amidohydrolase family protein, partial [Firmicutes bacterium]|nr:amidohydrolase family protein [Bacillota bacterium]
PVDALCRLLMEQNGSGAVVCFTMDEADVRTVMKHPATMLGSDGIPNAGKPHPRLYGTFPRVLGRYWREVGWLTLEEAIHKMTGLPALIYGLSDRGVLAEGKKADMVVFDPDEIMDTATYEEPISYPRGIRRVLLNGRQAVEDGVVCDRTAGRLLRRA